MSISFLIFIGLTGLDFSSLTPTQKVAFEGALLRSVLGADRVLVVDQKDGAGRLEFSFHWLPKRGSLVLFPTIVKVKPIRQDVGELLIGGGDIRGKPEELRDPGLAKKYLEQEAYARSEKKRIWSVNGTE